MLPRSIGVSNLDAFRVWKETEGLDFNWILDRLEGRGEETEMMRAGKALHSALENGCEMEVGSLAAGEYRFDFNCQCEVVLPQVRELWLEKHYGDIQVRGIVDGLIGNMVVDYKGTEQFDPDRYMESFQWRLYLDMSECDVFLYQIFVLREFGPPGCYEVRDTHQLKQYRYPDLHRDCERLVDEYRAVMGSHLVAA